MSLSEDRKRHFQEFKDGKVSVFVITSSSTLEVVPKFTFRKIDDQNIAILAWVDRNEAENWLHSQKLNKSAVVELPYSELLQYLNGVSPVAPKNCKIELI
jgi:hypothetical protein